MEVLPAITVPGRIEAKGYAAMKGTQTEACGGWQAYVTKSSPSFSLEAGVHTLRLLSIRSQRNINWWELRSP